MFKLAKKLIFVAIVLGVIAFGLDRLLDVNDFRECNLSAISDKCQKADAVVVISGGDTKARTLYAAKLVNQGLAPILITSGASKQDGVPSNAEEMRDIAINEGVYVGAILTDTQSRNTAQNAKYVKEVIVNYNENNLRAPIQSVILVTSGYHQNRAYREFRAKLPPEMRIFNAPVTEDKDWSQTWFLTPRGWYLAISESAGMLISPRE